MSVAESTEVEPVETVVDLLSNQPTTLGGYGFNYGREYGTGEKDTWTLAEPEVFEWTEVSQKSKENNSDPALYVWSPVDTDLQEFDAEGSRQLDQNTVEIQVWTLSKPDSAQYARDVRDILEEYMRDNYANTNWHRIRPESMNDARSEKIARRTDHYIYTIQVELEDLRQSGL